MTLFGRKHEVWSEMTWAKGLFESLDAAERAMLKLAERPEPRPYVIVISWSGNDVVPPYSGLGHGLRGKAESGNGHH